MSNDRLAALRPADVSDAWALAGLRHAGLIELGLLREGDDPHFIDRAALELRALFGSERIVTWVLVDDGAIVGCASAVFWQRLPYPGSSVHAEISGVYVAPAYRSQGFASELVREAVAGARARNVRKIVLRPVALKRDLYRRLGFVDDGDQMSLAS